MAVFNIDLDRKSSQLFNPWYSATRINVMNWHRGSHDVIDIFIGTIHKVQSAIHGLPVMSNKVLWKAEVVESQDTKLEDNKESMVRLNNEPSGSSAAARSRTWRPHTSIWVRQGRDEQGYKEIEPYDIPAMMMIRARIERRVCVRTAVAVVMVLGRFDNYFPLLEARFSPQ